MANEAPDTPDKAFSRVLKGILRPLVRALIARGVTAPALYRQLKRLYVEVAEQDFPLEGQRSTDSRISLLTGVHRRDVRSFRDADSAPMADTREKVTTIATLLGRWMAGADTTDDQGRPLPLPRSADGVSFENIVREISRDIRPRTVYDELVRQNLVVTDPDTGLIHLRADAFVGPGDLEQKVHFFAENVGDHIAAAVDNLLEEPSPFMERAVFYNCLTGQSVDAIEEKARRLGTDMLIELNRDAHGLQAQDTDAPDSSHRFRFGVFFYREDEANARAEDPGVQRGQDEER